MGDLGSIPGLGRPPEEGKGYPLQHAGLENSMDCIIHRVAKSRTQLSDFHFQGNKQKLKEKMGFPDSSVGKESTCSVGDTGSIPGLGRYAREGIGYPL